MARRDRCSLFLTHSGSQCANQAKFLWTRYPVKVGTHGNEPNLQRPAGAFDPRPVCIDCRNGHARANGGVEIGRWTEI